MLWQTECLEWQKGCMTVGARRGQGGQCTSGRASWGCAREKWRGESAEQEGEGGAAEGSWQGGGSYCSCGGQSHGAWGKSAALIVQFAEQLTKRHLQDVHTMICCMLWQEIGKSTAFRLEENINCCESSLSEMHMHQIAVSLQGTESALSHNLNQKVIYRCLCPKGRKSC